MKDETLSTDSTHANKKLVPSFSVPNFKEKNDSNKTNKDNNKYYRLNFNYDSNKVINNSKPKDTSSNNDYKKEKESDGNSNSNINTELYYPYFNTGNSKLKQVFSNCEEYLYKEGDDYEKLILKNKNLKRLFEKVNTQLITCLNKQQKLEQKYKNEKKEIIEKLSKIQENYEIYANSHHQLSNLEDKIDEISSTYNQLLELYFKTNEKMKNFRNNVIQLYKNINNFVDKNCGNDKVNILSFEFLLHLRGEIKKQFQINDENPVNKNNTQRNNYNDVLNNKTAQYYLNQYHNNDYSKNEGKTERKNIFSTNTNFYLINKTKKEAMKKKEIKDKIFNKKNNKQVNNNK